MSPRPNDNVFCGQDLAVDSAGSRTFMTVDHAMQEKEDERCYRLTQGRGTDGKEVLTYALFVKEKKCACEKQK